MLELRDPGDEPLDPHPEPRVGHASEPSQVEVPLEVLLGEAVLLEPLFQESQVVDALTASDDLAVALGRENVDAENPVGSLGMGLHVKGLDLGWVVGHGERTVGAYGGNRL